MHTAVVNHVISAHLRICSHLFDENNPAQARVKMKIRSYGLRGKLEWEGQTDERLRERMKGC